MIVLDLASNTNEQFTRTNSYFGQPFIYNTLFNFGGNFVLYDKVSTMNSKVFEARSMTNSTMIGTGYTPEGLGNTYIGSEFLGEMSWRTEPVASLADWGEQYAARRFGHSSKLGGMAYNKTTTTIFSSSGGFPGRVRKCFNLKFWADVLLSMRLSLCLVCQL